MSGIAPAGQVANVVDANAITEQPAMKIIYQRPNDVHHSKPVFVTVNKFETDSFPVRVRYLSLGKTLGSNSFSEVSSIERREISQHKRQSKRNPSDAVVKPLDIAPRAAGPASAI